MLKYANTKHPFDCGFLNSRRLTSKTMSTHVGEVKIPTQEDFDYFINLVKDEKGWAKSYAGKNKSLPVNGYTRVIEGNDIKAAKVSIFNFSSIFKVEATFKNVSALNVYESLQDPEYRKTWDEAMKEGSRICYVAPNSEIGYYRCKLTSLLIYFAHYSEITFRIKRS